MISEEQQKKDERYMRMALDEAQIAYEAGEIPIGAVIVCQDRVISRAHNLLPTPSAASISLTAPSTSPLSPA